MIFFVQLLSQCVLVFLHIATNLTASLNFPSENSTPSLHMERGSGVLDLRSNDGVRLK